MKKVLILLFFASNVVLSQNFFNVSVSIDTTNKLSIIPSYLFGSNLVANRNNASNTVLNNFYTDSSKTIAPSVLRWPGGNISDHYDWKSDQIINPGRRVQANDIVNISQAIVFAKKINTDLSVTINFGTMSANDAADMVEFLNGSGSTFWGKKRDSILVSNGYSAGPMNVRYFEIGNEILQKHMYDNSWSAENPYRYFLGGGSERRGGYASSFNGQQISIPKGDLIRIRNVDSLGASFYLRFPPVKNVDVYFIPDSASLANCVLNNNCNFEKFTLVNNLGSYSSTDKVFVMDSVNGIITFGDNVHGFMPPVDSYILVEYTTFGHDGFVNIARKMRQVNSSVPIKIGAVMLPRDFGALSSNWVPIDSLKSVFEQMDFFVVHHYLKTNSGSNINYNFRRQTAEDRINKQDSLFNLYKSSSLTSLGFNKEIGLGITEWNLFNTNDSLVRGNRSIESALISAEWFIKTLNKIDTSNIVIANQFNLSAWNSKFGLIETDIPSYVISPQGKVFEKFKTWKNIVLLKDIVNSPSTMAYNKNVPLIYSASAITYDNDSLFVVLTNNSDADSANIKFVNFNFNYSSVNIYTISGSNYYSNNDDINNIVNIRDINSTNRLDSVTLPPLSVTFITFIGNITGLNTAENTVPDEYFLSQNYPNPFNPVTKINYSVPRSGNVQIKVFDILGHEITELINEYKHAGKYAIEFDAGNLPSGVYFYKIISGSYSETKKMILLK